MKASEKSKQRQSKTPVKFVDRIDLTLRILLALFFIGAGFQEFLHAEIVVVGLEKLGYPIYILKPLAICKWLGAIALLKPGAGLIREWAYAGYVFNLSGATVSLLCSDQLIFPDIFLAPTVLAILIGSYILHRMKSEHPVLY